MGTWSPCVPSGSSFEPRDRSVLDSYARLAAAALDSEAAVVEARRQATTAQALLALSSTLADLSTSEEMAAHLCPHGSVGHRL